MWDSGITDELKRIGKETKELGIASVRDSNRVSPEYKFRL
jgi:hypothetical protein